MSLQLYVQNVVNVSENCNLITCKLDKMSNITFVTCFYKIYENTDLQFYFDHFLKFANEGYPIVLFLDNEVKKEWNQSLLNYKNVTTINDFPFNNFPLVSQYPKETTKLPSQRNLTKDTYEYIVLMNSKLNLILNSLNKVETEYVAWIDFGIFKILQNETKIKKLEYIQIPNDKILIPGCHKVNSSNDDFPNWRFCGGLLFGKPLTFLKFYELTNSYFEKNKDNQSITWDVNVWAHIEEECPELFEWYKADHNDKILDFPLRSADKKIILILMIKNEEKIIKRCIEKALQTNIIDAICISDTGSTDSTLDVLKEHSKSFSVPIKIVQHEWKNFGFNRTLSFIETQNFCKELGWDSNLTYGLAIDADMNFIVKPEFSKNSLNSDGYRIIQKAGGLEYHNSRFFRLSNDWRCIGVTHEYWGGFEAKNLDSAYIEDIGDGGCKSDKFERDIKLLEQGLQDEPKNERYMFYLAQSYKDVGRLDDAIKMYKKRIESGGWYEEVWYSMYQITRIYYQKKDFIKMEYWGQLGYQFYPKRSENLYILAVAFRELGHHHKAWHYMTLGRSIKRGEDLLFVECNVYNHLFKAEKTILNYYVQNHKKEENLRELIDYFNNNGENVYHNLQHYVYPISLIREDKLPCEEKDNYIPSSTSILPLNDEEYLLNVRYVNYRIQPNGSYLMYKDDKLSHDNPVMTRNFSHIVDSNFFSNQQLIEAIPTFQPLHNAYIKGIEDLRLYKDGETIRFIGTSMDHSYNCKIRQIVGDYDHETGTLSKAISVHPPTETECEKNWIPIGNNRFIYSWYPMQIGEIENDTLVIKETFNTPKFFKHMRGSTNIVNYKNSKYCITHCVQYLTPRKYYHILVRLNKDTLQPEAYSLPFYFKNNDIEYTLGLAVNKDETFTTIVSQRDSNPLLLTFNLEACSFTTI
jgi:hypothetical protein